MKTFSDYLNEAKQWYVDVTDKEGTDKAGPFKTEREAAEYKKAMESHASSGEVYDCSEPYQDDDSSLNESMSKDEKKEFYAKLQKEKVRFQFKKKNGEVRDAYGTLIAEYLPKPADPKDTKASARDRFKRQFPEDSVLYYDLDKKAFRSFKMSNFIKYL